MATLTLAALMVQASRTDASTRAHIPVRDCASSVYGNLGKDWRTRPGAIVVGPIAFPAPFAPSPRDPAFLFRAVRGRYLAQKVLLVVNANTTVRLVVPSDERGTVRLFYDQAAWRRASPDGRYRLTDGTTSFVFEACSTETQLNGGFLVAGRRCARILVFTRGQTGALTARLPFGRSCRYP